MADVSPTTMNAILSGLPLQPFDESLPELAHTPPEQHTTVEPAYSNENKIKELEAEVALLKGIVKGLQRYLDRLEPWTKEVHAALSKLGKEPQSASPTRSELSMTLHSHS
ncbi:hypothetical protein D8B26_005385 [Coccidioides posadasii str. Silveira]|uniref:uncharacterized protein n=1 Tax=Coccidioides posadasii (strain RMSCC 757 / Silveira) TaxID=443226 RepID=UPI001BF0039E|nr:hypothetical protein D8B26_005385 [Coccidioides posadasii str. Silveira]